MPEKTREEKGQKTTTKTATTTTTHTHTHTQKKNRKKYVDFLPMQEKKKKNRN